MVAVCAYAQADHIEDYVPSHFGVDTYHGIDVSNHQGVIDWKKVASDENVQFVYIKATEGATYVSPTFEKNIREARKAGMKVGCYHFLRASSYIRDQVANFTNFCRTHEQDLAPLIDIEVKGSWKAENVSDSVKLFADLLEEHYGVRPIIYTGTNFFNRYLTKDFSEGYELFIAKYSDDQPVLGNGVQYTLWQFTDCGEVSGIRTDVDQSRFNEGKSLNDILFRPVPRDPNYIATRRMVKPIISLNMQNPAKLRNSRAEKFGQKQKKALKVHKKNRNEHRPHHKRNDIEDEDDYMPTPAQSAIKSNPSES
jgi:lysozyme